MDNKVKFFDEVFKLLLALTACAWLIYIALVIFAGDTTGCIHAGWLFTASAWTAGIFSAPPIVYGLGRLLFWPGGSKGTKVKVMGWGLSVGAGIFISLVIIFALVVSQFGCQ